MKKMNKKTKTAFRAFSVVSIVVGIALLLFALLTPAGKTYKNDNTSYEFKNDEVTETLGSKTGIVSTIPWELKKDEDGNNCVYLTRDLLITNVKTELGKFTGLSIIAYEDAENPENNIIYKSEAALIMVIVGSVLCFFGLASEGFVCVSTYSKKQVKKKRK